MRSLKQKPTFIALALIVFFAVSSGAAVLFKYDVRDSGLELNIGTVVRVNAANQITTADGTDRSMQPAGVIIAKEDDSGTMKYLVSTSGIIEITGGTFTPGARLTYNSSGMIVEAANDEDVLIGVALSATRVKIEFDDNQAKFGWVDPTGISSSSSNNLQVVLEEMDDAIDAAASVIQDDYQVPTTAFTAGNYLDHTVEADVHDALDKLNVEVKSDFDQVEADLADDDNTTIPVDWDGIVDVPADLSGQHNDLSGIQGGATGDYWHLTGTQHTDLIGGGNADAQHSHDADNVLNVTGGTYIAAGDVDAALTALDVAIATVAAVDNWVNETGDNMTGNLSFNGGATANITAASGDLWSAGDVYMANNQQLFMKNSDGSDQAWITPRNGSNDMMITMGSNDTETDGNNFYIQDKDFANVAQFSGGANALWLFGDLQMQDKSIWDADYVETNYIQDGEDGTVEVLDNLTVDGNAGVTAGNDLYVGAIGLDDVGTGATTSGAHLIGYNNTSSSLASTDVQGAIDDLDGAIDGLSSGSWDHNDLSGIQGGAADDYWHLTGTQHTDLIGGGNADAQHSHDADNVLNVTGGTYIAAGDVDAALTALDVAIDGIATGSLANLTNGAGIAVLDYDGSVTDEVAIDNSWFTNDISVSTGGVVDITNNAVQSSDIDWGSGADQIDAGEVPIVDAGSYYTSTDVEGALQEIGTLTGGSVVNQITGGDGIVPNGPLSGNVTLDVDLTELSYNGLTASSSTQLDVEYGTTANSAVEGNQTGAITAGNGLTGDMAANPLGDGFSASLAVGDGNGLTVNTDDINVNVDDATIGITTDVLHVKNDGIQDEHIDWATGGATPTSGEVSAADVPLEDADGHFGTDNVEFAIDDLADRLDDVEGGGGQGMAMRSHSTATNITSTSFTTIFSSLPYTLNSGSKLLINFTGTFDDRGSGQNGAYLEIDIYDGTTSLASRTIVLNDRNFFQSQEVSLNYVMTTSGPHTISVRARVVKTPYTSGRFVNGNLTLTEVNSE